MNNHERQNLCHVVGIGAIGTIIAASFCRNNTPVQLVLKNEEAVRNYQKTSLQLLSEDIAYTCKPSVVSLSQLSQPIRFLVCCTKAHSVLELLFSLRYCLDAQSIIILLHNGMGVLEDIQNKMPNLRIVSGITTLGGYLQAPYKVNAFLKGKTILGAALGCFSSEEIDEICSMFYGSDLQCEWSNSIHLFIWEKFAINCSINLLTVLWSCKNGHLLNRFNEVEPLISEVVLVLTAYEVAITFEYLLEKVKSILKLTAENYSSMHQDIQNGKPTEINYLNRYLVFLAEKKNINLSYSRRLLEQFDNYEFQGV